MAAGCSPPASRLPPVFPDPRFTSGIRPRGHSRGALIVLITGTRTDRCSDTRHAWFGRPKKDRLLLAVYFLLRGNDVCREQIWFAFRKGACPLWMNEAFCMYLTGRWRVESVYPEVVFFLFVKFSEVLHHFSRLVFGQCTELKGRLFVPINVSKLLLTSRVQILRRRCL